jgi:hypothetical protein
MSFKQSACTRSARDGNRLSAGGEMVAPVHLLYQGGEHERVWLEDAVHVTRYGGGRYSHGLPAADRTMSER